VLLACLVGPQKPEAALPALQEEMEEDIYLRIKGRLEVCTECKQNEKGNY
jgi:hypothetical protein